MEQLVRMYYEKKIGGWLPVEERGQRVKNAAMSLLFKKFRDAPEWYARPALNIFLKRTTPPTMDHVEAYGFTIDSQTKGLSEFLEQHSGRYEIDGSASNFTELTSSTIKGIRRFHFSPLAIDSARAYRLMVEKDELRRNLDAKRSGVTKWPNCRR